MGDRAGTRRGSALALLVACLIAVAVLAGGSAVAQDPPVGQPGSPAVVPQDPVPPTRAEPDLPPARPSAQDPAQDPAGPAVDPAVQALQGKVVRTIVVARIGQNGRILPLVGEVADSVLRTLVTRAGEPLDARKVTQDVANLWNERRLVTVALARPVGEEVELTIGIRREDEVYERVEFQGLKHFERGEVDELLGLYTDRQVTSSEAIAMRNVLVARYRRDGFAFCSVDLQETDPEDAAGVERPRKILTLRIDEGPRVTVREVRFRGHRSYPARPLWGFVGSGDFLIRDSHIQSDPAGAILFIPLRGEPFSREIIDEDLDRLRLFYRSRGHLDALVELGDVQFTADRTEVDIDFLVVEGPRYRIRSIGLVRLDPAGKEIADGDARYPSAEVLQDLKVVPGDFYDHAKIRQDLRRIQDFYGQRGHPPRASFSQSVADAFQILWPRERYSETFEVDLTHRLEEGSPKTLRDVILRGNTATRDKVIRRKVYQMPGERLDMTLVDKSMRHLDATRYFFNPITLQGPRFELLPVPGKADEVDLALDLEEGETGEFRWGIGISTGAGAQATLQFNKKNFDLWNPPSSLNPFTALGEIIDNRAFHGGGQQLDLLLAPGTEISQFQIAFTEPDIFGDHFDTYELRVAGRRRIRRFRDGYTTDVLGGDVGFGRNFTEFFSAGLGFRHETVKVRNLTADAPLIAFDAEGQTELRGLRATARYRDHDDPRRPTKGFDVTATAEVVGGFLGGEESLVKGTVGGNLFVPLLENAAGHWHVLRLEQSFGIAQEFGGSDDVFLTERFYLGGGNLRGFDYRGVGPSQFQRAIGGEAVYSSTLEYSYPLVATRMEHQVRDSELLRGVVFSDFGLLGLGLSDPTFTEPRLSVGVGLRIEIPVLEIPIALDLGWPILFEESDSRRQFFFSIAR